MPFAKQPQSDDDYPIIWPQGRPQEDQQVWPDGAPLHPQATPEQDAVPVPDGYPAPTWADNNSDTGWLFGVHPHLRDTYASIPADDPRLDHSKIADNTVIPVGDRVPLRLLSKFAVDAWPQVFTPVAGHGGTQMFASGHAYHVDRAYWLHLERKQLAATIVQEEEQRQAATSRAATCTVCDTPYQRNTVFPSDMCGPCVAVQAGLTRTFGPQALDPVGDRTRLGAVLRHLGAAQLVL